MSNALRVARIAIRALGIGHLPGASAAAEELKFGPDLQQAGWVIVTFPGIAPASFKPVGRATREVSADSAAGLLYHTVSRMLQHATRAHWRWLVYEGVPPTDLTKRGADDRALGVYFVLGNASDVGKSPTALLSVPQCIGLYGN